MLYKFCVLGNPIAHSKSPIIHQEFAKQAKFDIHYEKLLVLTEPGEFDATILQLKLNAYKGCNITLPFKEQAFQLADFHSQSAIRAKAVNTYLFKPDGSIYADNTDGIGLIRDMQNTTAYSLEDKRILICGAGGAARGILYPIIQQQPLSLTIANRDTTKATRLANEFADCMPINACSYHELEHKEFDAVIDATAFSTEALPLPTSLKLSSNSLCYDLKYSDKQPITSFMSWAKAKGCLNVHDGVGMLVEQAAESFYIWTGFKPETSSVIEFLRKE
jgi:shikimate dehydrogenase